MNHNQSACAMCRDDASAHNHCASCGETFADLGSLLVHLDTCESYMMFIHLLLS